MAQRPLRPELLHEQLEGHVLVLERPEHRLPGAAQVIPEREVVRDLRAQYHGVDEEAEHPLQFGAWPAGHGGSHHDVTLSGHAGQQYLVGGQQHHVEGAALRPRP